MGELKHVSDWLKVGVNGERRQKWDLPDKELIVVFDEQGNPSIVELD